MLEIWENNKTGKTLQVFHYTEKDNEESLRKFLSDNGVNVTVKDGKIDNGLLVLNIENTDMFFMSDNRLRVTSVFSLYKDYSYVGVVEAAEKDSWDYPKYMSEEALDIDDLKKLTSAWNQLHNMWDSFIKSRSTSDSPAQAFHKQLLFMRNSTELICNLEEDYTLQFTGAFWDKRKQVMPLEETPIIECMQSFNWNFVTNSDKIAFDIYCWFEDTLKNDSTEGSAYNSQFRANFTTETLHTVIPGLVVAHVEKWSNGDILRLSAELFDSEYNPYC